MPLSWVPTTISHPSINRPRGPSYFFPLQNISPNFFHTNFFTVLNFLSSKSPLPRPPQRQAEARSLPTILTISVPRGLYQFSLLLSPYPLNTRLEIFFAYFVFSPTYKYLVYQHSQHTSIPLETGNSILWMFWMSRPLNFVNPFDFTRDDSAYVTLSEKKSAPIDWTI